MQILPILIIIFIVSQLSKRTKQVKNNRPGQGARPTPGGTPVRDRAVRRPYMPAQPIAQPTVAPSYTPPQPEPASEPEQTDYTAGMLDDSDRARTDLTEGDSRECDHGSLGGSMDITSHAGMGEEFEHAEQRAKPNVKPAYAAAEQAASLQSPTKLTAAQMRQAIVWAEILKRPSERWQSGRWSAR